MAHSHAAAGRRMVPVAVIMTLLGATELVLGLSGQNALILADGSHNLVDAGFTLIGAFVFILSGQTKNHFNNCTLPLLTAAATYAGTLILVSLLAFPEFSELEHLTRGELWLTVALASIAAAANFLTSLLLERGGHHLEHATWLHLMSDVALSAVVIAAALLALIWV
jgi:Co/Zn/Cd efflux system component